MNLFFRTTIFLSISKKTVRRKVTMARKCGGECGKCSVVLKNKKVKDLRTGSGVGIKCTSDRGIRKKLSVRRERSGGLRVAAA